MEQLIQGSPFNSKYLNEITATIVLNLLAFPK